MANYVIAQISEYFNRGDTAANTSEKGRALEDLLCYIFSKVPGISINKRDQRNVFDTEEIDIAFWNEQSKKGMSFLPNILLVECKNWSKAVSSIEVTWFINKLRSRGRDYGILVATNGITGNPKDLTDSHFAISTALKDGIHVIVITRKELEKLHTTDDFIRLIKEKLCELAVFGTALCDIG